MNFDAERMRKLAGLNESTDTKSGKILRESRLMEEEGAEAPAEEPKLDQAALKDAVKQLATALGMTVTEPEGGEAPADDAGGDDAGLEGLMATESLSFGKVKQIIRDELSANWASGQVFGKKNTNRGGITMGFKGIGFK
jgi:hypothetical protein